MNRALSRKAAAKIQWDGILECADEQELGTTRHLEGGGERPPEYDQRVRAVFDVVKREFGECIESLKKQVRITLWIIFPALAISIALGTILAVLKTPVGGSILTSGGLLALFGFMVRAWELARDQLILEFVPTHYEALFRLCVSDEQYEEVFRSLLEEMVELRRNLR